ncbi:hypothetical protein FXO37_08883 [Capsicum annuum]|nr:hypothetical protein FXO37_08883 [Capsicum annuum]
MSIDIPNATNNLDNLNTEMKDNELDDANNEVNGNDPKDASKGCDTTIQHDELSKKEKRTIIPKLCGIGSHYAYQHAEKKNKKKVKPKKAKLGSGFVIAEATLSNNSNLSKLFCDCKEYVIVTCQRSSWVEKIDELCQEYVANKYDHRELNKKQELFYFDPLSPGSCFFLPHVTRIRNKLLEFIKNEYWKRGYEGIRSPDIYKM